MESKCLNHQKLHHLCLLLGMPISDHKSKSPSLASKFPTKSDVDASQDPQLTAYIKGLERLKARLNKTSM